MRRLMWREWAETFPGGDLACHPVVIDVARALSGNMNFLRWLGHDHPVVMSLEPIAMIAVAALCRIRNRFGKFDISEITVNVRPDRLDDEIGVPGLMDALWAAGMVQETTAISFRLKHRPGSFPRGYDEALEGRARKWHNAELASIRQSVLVGMSSPVSTATTPEA